MNSTIAIMLAQDGLTNGVIYALLALAILLVFLVTRILWVSAGDFAVLGGVTFSTLQRGQVPQVIWLIVTLSAAAIMVETAHALRSRDWRAWRRYCALIVLAPAPGLLLVLGLAPQRGALACDMLLTVLLVVPLGPLLYRAAFQRVASSSVLTLLFVAMASHYVLLGLGLFFFGPEGYRTDAFLPGRLDIGVTTISWQSLLIVPVVAAFVAALWWFYEKTLWGKALRAVAVNRLGARLIAIRPQMAGAIAFTVGAGVCVLSGMLIVPLTTLYYDSGFLIVLKGFVGTVLGGLVSFPLSLAGALLVGVIESFASYHASAFKEAIVFGLMVPILLWRSAFEKHAIDEAVD
jgi:branched-chain amino acid transport system permease protein